MKPILIRQHLNADGPAYLVTWLRRRAWPHRVVNAQSGKSFPDDMGDYSALAILGGEMSANDPLPSLQRAEALILVAMARNRPVIGHCLGGQLMARALGARVGPSAAPEIGWQRLTVENHDEALAWFGQVGQRHVFQWHGEAFELPAGATRLAGSDACVHQAFAIGPHLAMQIHVELDEEKLRRWSTVDSPGTVALQRRFATVQSGPEMVEAMAVHLDAQQALANRIYQRWISSALHVDP